MGALKDGDIIKFGSSTREYHVRLRLDDGDEREESESEPEEPKSTSSKKRKKDADDEEKPKKKQKTREPEEDDEETSKKVSCRHILVKHKDSRRPHSWKSDEITRTKEDAVGIAEKYLKKLRAADDLEQAFVDLATKESDCNSAKRGGDLGKFGKGKMQKPFEEAAFALKVGELSKPVTTLSGIHIIMRHS